MTLRRPIFASLLLAALIIPLALNARRFGQARAQLESAHALLTSTRDTARRVGDLRASQQRIAERKRPPQDVIAKVNSALRAAQIPLERFGGLRPESDSALAGSAGGASGFYRRQTLRISLNGLTTRQLGGFLSQWRVSQQLWTPTRIDLTHVRDEHRPDLYDAAILIVATYVADQ